MAKREIKKKRVRKTKPKKKHKTAGNPTGKGGFQKGFSGNPNGRPKDPPEIKAIREAYKNDLFQAAAWASNLERPLTKKEKKIFGDIEKLSLLQIGVGKAFLLCSYSGSIDVIKYITDHLIGKPRETLDIENPGGTTIVYNTPVDYLPKLHSIVDNDSSDSSKP